MEAEGKDRETGRACYRSDFVEAEPASLESDQPCFSRDQAMPGGLGNGL